MPVFKQMIYSSEASEVQCSDVVGKKARRAEVAIFQQTLQISDR